VRERERGRHEGREKEIEIKRERGRYEDKDKERG
jgi:hypothetical protein